MKGKYKHGDCTLTDPTVTVYSHFIDHLDDTVKIEVNVSDGKDGMTIIIPDFDDPKQVPETTSKTAIKNWAENYLKKYKQ